MKKIIAPIFLICFVASSIQGQTNDAIYNAFKTNQFNFPPPPNPRDTVYVGEWDPSISDPEVSFTGIKGGIVEPQYPVRVVKHLPGIGYSFSFKYTLKFNVKNLPAGSVFSVKINDIVYQSNPGKSSIYIDVRDKKSFDWQIRYGSNSYKDKLQIQRIPVVVAGVFKVPLMPLLVIYEPPGNNTGSNKTDFSQINMFGSSSTMTVTKDENRTTTNVEFTDIEKLKLFLKVEGSVLSKIPDPHAQAAGTVLQILSSDALWGGVTSTSTSGKIKENELSLIVESWNTQTITTDINDGGPGMGDIIKGVKDCRFLWIINDGKFSATMLDYKEPFKYTAIDIKDSILHSIRKDIYISLAKVDPFITYGPNFNLRSQPRRYEFRKPLGGDTNGSGGEIDEERQKVTQLDRNTEVDYTINIEDYKQGLFSYINLSPYDKTETLRTEIRNKMSNQIDRTSETITKLYLQNNQGEHRKYEVFVDKIYGTFAIQDPNIAVPVKQFHEPPLNGLKGTKTGVTGPVKGSKPPVKTRN